MTETFINTVEQDTTAAQNKAKRNKLLMGLGALVLLLGLTYYLWDLFIGSQRVTTDDAYVGAETAMITPMVAGQIADVKVSDTQLVHRGDVLAVIDDSDARIALASAEADLAKAKRGFTRTAATSSALAAQMSARGDQVSAAQAQLSAAQSAYSKAQLELRHRQQLAPSGAVSGEELTAAANAFAAAQANLAVARGSVAQAQSGRVAASGDLAANQALIAGATAASAPDVQAAQARVDQAHLALTRTVIRAPIDGMISKRTVQMGQSVVPGSSLMMVVPVNSVYVDANFKEVQLKKVHPGQPATMTSDLYGSGVVYHGKVVGLAGGTGSAFALIPAQNATGNWIKVVQRVPVRIALDPQELAAHPLRVGLSMNTEIDISDK